MSGKLKKVHFRKLIREILTIVFILSCFLTGCKNERVKNGFSGNLLVYNDNLDTRWSSPENLNGEKGMGGKANNGAKGHAFDSLELENPRYYWMFRDRGL